jgi:hypothetical protein
MITSWHRYPSTFNLGHPNLSELFADPIVVEEKIDGSQFSFGIFDGQIKVRSKGKEIFLENPEKMFLPAIETVLKLKDLLRDGWTYRAEFLSKPKHNTLCYNRTPKDFLILFDVNPSEETYLDYTEKFNEANRLGLECVPLLHAGEKLDYDQFKALLQKESVLGGPKIEGFVVKNYFKFGRDKKCLIGKFVSEDFKEKHGVEWKKMNPGQDDIIHLIGSSLKTEARWNKAIQHLRDEGKLENSARDIGLLLKEVGLDVLKDSEQEIKEQLWNYAWPKINRIIVRGLPEWYKDKLLKDAVSPIQG